MRVGDMSWRSGRRDRHPWSWARCYVLSGIEIGDRSGPVPLCQLGLGLARITVEGLGTRVAAGGALGLHGGRGRLHVPRPREVRASEGVGVVVPYRRFVIDMRVSSVADGSERRGPPARAAPRPRGRDPEAWRCDHGGCAGRGDIDIAVVLFPTVVCRIDSH